MALSQLLQACRTLFGDRGRAGRVAERETARRRDIQRKQLLMLQLNDALKDNQPRKPKMR